MAEYETTRLPTRIAISIVFVAAAGAAAYFLLHPRSERAAAPSAIASNLQQPAQDELPVHVITPPSYGGLLPELQNSSDKPLALRVTVRRPSSNQQHQWQIELKPNEMFPLARQGGWTFAAGDELELLQDGHRPKKVTLQ